MPAAAARCAISADVVDLPLVPVIATNGAPGAWRCRSRQNSSMSPITSTPASRATSPPPRGAGGERRTWRQDQRGKTRPVYVAQVGGDKSGSCSLRQSLRTVVARDHLGAAGLQRMTARQPRAAEAEHRDRLARKGSDGDQDDASLAFLSPPPLRGGETLRSCGGRGGRICTLSKTRDPAPHPSPARGEGAERPFMRSVKVITAASTWRGRRAPASPR